MSAYRLIKSQVSDGEAIVAALVDMGIPREAIEIHETPQSLHGYRGDRRAQKAHIIVRRKYINKHFSSGASNDLGFERKADGKYVVHVSDYDQSWWMRKQDRFQQVAAAEQATRQARRRGYTVQKTEQDGKIVLKLKRSY